MTTSATLMAATASQDRAAAAQLERAAADARAAGRLERTTARRQACPYELGTLAAHVWVRWYVHARLSAAGMP